MPSSFTVDVLKAEPGDVIVIHAESRLTGEQATTILEQFRPLFPDNEVVIFPPAITAQAVRQAVYDDIIRSVREKHPTTKEGAA